MACITDVTAVVARGQGAPNCPEVIRGETDLICLHLGQSGQASQRPPPSTKTLNRLGICFLGTRRHFWASVSFLIERFRLLLGA